MYVEGHKVDLTTNASGAATGYTPVLTAAILGIAYVKDDFVDGIDITITTETTKQNIYVKTSVNASIVVYPRVTAHDTVGAAIFFEGTNILAVPVLAGNERVKVVIADGGDTKHGDVIILAG